MVYGTSNGPQNNVGNYLGPCSTHLVGWLVGWLAGLRLLLQVGWTRLDVGFLCSVESSRESSNRQREA